jgi:hypothetical protein
MPSPTQETNASSSPSPDPLRLKTLLGSQIDFQERRTCLRFDHNQRPIQQMVNAMTEFSLGLRPAIAWFAECNSRSVASSDVVDICDASNETNRSMTRFGCLFPKAGSCA